MKTKMSPFDVVHSMDSAYDKFAEANSVPIRVDRYPVNPSDTYFWSNDDLLRWAEKFNVKISFGMGDDEGFSSSSPLANGGELIVFVPYSKEVIVVTLRDAFGWTPTQKQGLKQACIAAKPTSLELEFKIE